LVGASCQKIAQMPKRSRYEVLAEGLGEISRVLKLYANAANLTPKTPVPVKRTALRDLRK